MYVLKRISIENIAVIERADIELEGGFNVLTGETGAGKSIIIDSVNAVLGERTSRELVRNGCSKAAVSALFVDLSESEVTALSGLGITVDGNELLINRTLSADGRNSCRVNGAVVSVGVLKNICKRLVNIHGQHDSQALLDQSEHIQFLDAYAENGALISDYRGSFVKLRDVKREIKRLESEEAEKQRVSELYEFEIKEITSADIKSGELDALKVRRAEILGAEKILDALGSVTAYLNGDDETVGAIGAAENSAQAADSIADLVPAAKNIASSLNEAAAILSDAAESARGAAEQLNIDPGELDGIEQRLDEIYRLCRKYGGSEDAVLAYLDETTRKMNNLQADEQKLSELYEVQNTLEDEVYEKGQKLTASRKKAGEKFSDKICGILKFLQMPNVVFSVDFGECVYTKSGCDRVEFLISANAGEPPRPLSKIASGGELSRVMLAIKSVMADKDDVPTLIFDEIDSGISGKAAACVGAQMKELSNTHQLICVTHLPQIAAAAGNHLLIEKSSEQGKTFTSVKRLEGDERAAEVARIISGGEMTENLYKTAKEMIENQ